MKRKERSAVSVWFVVCALMCACVAGPGIPSKAFSADDPLVELSVDLTQQVLEGVDLPAVTGPDTAGIIDVLLASLLEGDYPMAMQSAEALSAALQETQQEEIVPECATKLIPVAIDGIGIVQSVAVVLGGNTGFCALVEIPMGIIDIVDGMLAYDLCVAELEETPDEAVIAEIEQQRNALTSAEMLLILGQIQYGCLESPQQGYIQLLLKLVSLLV